MSEIEARQTVHSSGHAVKALATMRKSLVVACLMLAVLSSGIVATPEPAAAATSERTYTESRSDVRFKARFLRGGDLACGYAPWWASPLCSTGSAGSAYDYAADYGCSMKVKVTTRYSSFSWGRATYRYYPQRCLDQG